MKVSIAIILLLFLNNLNAQLIKKKQPEPPLDSFVTKSKEEILQQLFPLDEENKKTNNFNKRAVYRAGINFPQGLQFFTGVELKIVKNLTLNTTVGTSINAGTPGWTVTDPDELADSDKIGLSLFVSPELRYFFKVYNKEIKGKRFINFSGNYIAVKYFASAYSGKLTSASNNSFENVSAWQINVGSQYQVKRHFFMALYLGAVISHRPFNPRLPSDIPLLQYGFSIGYTL